ncbi:MAG TPA: 4-(cytidine 5'-diphospho)-2-C-methyl-D-erythritol kinase [candidate division Zixibacteria bacterium]|nr:4-(cytidine 5'-diphospho)-2-C-methyl-D-erythritol kinase [candidate division Zixibacteria bacterium]
MNAARLAAPGKLNLSLRVVGRRTDGYHLLDTVMVLLELADELLLLPGCAGLRVDGTAAEGVPVAPDANLAWRGLLHGHGGAPPAACLTLEKRIPAAAGLGGGSSDAAAGWRLGRWASGRADDMPDEATLHTLAAIGADVPFFAAGAAAARVGGIGERVQSVAMPEGGSEVVLAHPPFALSTAAVFAELRRPEWGAAGAGGNDLLAPALRLRPELEEVLRLVTAAGGAPQLTGSGPTVFARTDDPERADAIARRLERAGLRATRTRLRAQPASIEVLDAEHTEHDEDEEA